MPGVNVVVVGTSQGSATDLEGEYYILNLRPGTYSVSVSMIGYQTTISRDVRILSDHTVTLNFELSTKVLEASEIVVTADREVIIMDRSASEVHIFSEDINSVPKVRDIRDYINLEAGIENDLIRGGGLDQTALMIDGMSFIDNRSNEPVMICLLYTSPSPRDRG